MSAICAMVHRDGRPALPGALEPLFDAAPHRGRVRRRRADGPCVVGCQNLLSDDARAGIGRRGSLTIAFHGRLDNRSELERSLAHRSPGAPVEDEAALVLRAFEEWQEGCAGHLLGDFAFVIWDATRRLTYAARDPIGVKPLYYWLNDRHWIAATEFTQVIASGVPLAPCEAMVAELLTFDVRSRSETLYRDISRLPPGHWMVVSDRDVRVRSYWKPDPANELRYARDEDYASHFFEILRTAVVDRTPSNAPFAAYLSGGLDSSSIVCMTQALGRSFETFSLVFPENPEADERSYIESVSRHVRVPSHQLTVAPIEVAPYRGRAVTRADLPELPSDALGEPLLEAMRGRGLRVALTGVGGDFGFGGSLLHYADLLQQGDVAGLLRQWNADRATPDVGWSPGQVFSQGIRLLVPDAIRRAARPLARQLGWGIVVPPWVERGFAARTSLLDRLAAPRSDSGPALPSRRNVCELFESGWTSRLLETFDRAAADYGIELRHPFYDRRLVEFAVAIPESQRWRGRTTKFVMREAMRPLLPESVYARTGKADASAYVAPAIEVLGGEAALRRLHISGLGWIKAEVLVDMYRRARAQFDRGDADYCGAMFNVWVALAVDAWYGAMFVEDSSHEGHAQRRRPDSGAGGSRQSSDRHSEAEAVSLSGAR